MLINPQRQVLHHFLNPLKGFKWELKVPKLSLVPKLNAHLSKNQQCVSLLSLRYFQGREHEHRAISEHEQKASSWRTLTSRLFNRGRKKNFFFFLLHCRQGYNLNERLNETHRNETHLPHSNDIYKQTNPKNRLRQTSAQKRKCRVPSSHALYYWEMSNVLVYLISEA